MFYTHVEFNEDILALFRITERVAPMQNEKIVKMKKNWSVRESNEHTAALRGENE